ncbi:MAG: TolC family protein [Armatimonadota bacterium]|nr:TolC family protein [Armatimonadota bacterium]MDR7451203.1 TolC family protein [Armatimonadota bacterium]MDR7467192.1 TolC family protein [Armatimonadota bacterium]MDR7495205.1 TolC family protein [Armatimonadota bacterium]MDR7500084.1 TolC family protein [Armatimonadota bacterium]
MRGIRLIVVLTLLTTLAVGAPVPAQPAPPPPRSFSLTEAVTLALQQNMQLRVAAFEVAIARAQLAQARGAKGPQASAQGSYTRTQEQGPTVLTLGGIPVVIPPPSPNLYDVRLVLQYPLYTGGSLEAQIALAEANVRGAEATLERIRQSIVFSVRQAYFQVLLARAGLEVAERSVAQATENLRVARARVAAGASPRFDEVQAEVALASARQSQVRARNGMAQAVQALAGLLNLPVNTPLTLTETFSVRPVRDTADALVARSLQSRPEFAELAARQAAAEAGIRLAESGARPTLAVQGGGSYSNTTGLFAGQAATASWSVTLAATLNLYDGGITRERIREARLRLEQLRAMEAQQKLSVELEVRQAYLNLLSAAEELSGADALIAQAQEALRIATVRFQSGVGTTLEVLNAQTSASEAEAAKAQALFNYNLARATLERAVGAEVP